MPPKKKGAVAVSKAKQKAQSKKKKDDVSSSEEEEEVIIDKTSKKGKGKGKVVVEQVVEKRKLSEVKDQKEEVEQKKEEQEIPKKKFKAEPIKAAPAVKLNKDCLEKLAVDKEFYYKNEYHVFVDHSNQNKIYSSTLQYTSMRNNSNNNKFYIIQILLEDSNPNHAYVFKRWGRTGETGLQACRGPISKEKAIQEYIQRVEDKSGRCRYSVLSIKYDQKGEKQTEIPSGKSQETKNQESSLPDRVQELIKLIFDLKIQKQTMEEIGYDPKKMPLGSLGDETIKEAYGILTKIADALKEKATIKQLEDLSSDFFSKIPHDFGRTKMKDHVINTEESVRKKIEMLKTLTDMKIADKLLEKMNDVDPVIDQNYKKLNTKLNPVNKNDKMYKTIQQYIENNKERYKVTIDDIFEVDREGEEQRFRKDIGNNWLLWHGSRVSNYVGILSQGLRIAPPEAPVSGYNYGKGIYLADMFSKSADYCRSNTSGNTILIMLVKAALGRQNILQRTDYNAHNLPAGTDSVLGWGKIGPPESSQIKLDDGTIIPLGKAQNTKSSNYMQHNEYMVYNVDRACIKYLIRARLD